MRKEPVAMKLTYVGLDVHAQTIAVAVAEGGRKGEVRSLGTIPNTPQAVARLMKKLGSPTALRVCYEAGPCGYVLYWQVTKLGIHCEVIAPTLIPKRVGDKVKTDRRDSEMLARLYRAGELTAVWVPDEAHEALRDLVRAREAAVADEHRARQRLQKLLLRRGRRPPSEMTPWTSKYMEWLGTVEFAAAALQATFSDYLSEIGHQGARIWRLERSIDEAVEHVPEHMKAVIAALQAMRGIAKTTAVGIVAELGQVTRFGRASELMAYAGAVPREYSTGGPGNARRGAITKTGNAHLRRLVGEAAWAYRHRPSMYRKLKKRQEQLTPAICEIAWKAQHRLYGRYHRLAQRMPRVKAMTAVSRELLGFIWAIGVEAEAPYLRTSKTKAA
jgi:transposase